MSKKSFRYRNQVTCPHCHQKYPTNSNYECPYCHTKFYDLSFVDLKKCCYTIEKYSYLTTMVRFPCAKVGIYSEMTKF